MGFLEDLEEYFQSDKFKEELKKDQQREECLDAFYQRWYEKLNKLPIEELKAIVRKVNAKYNSFEYIDRFYSHPQGAREPYTDLYWFAYELAKRYGKDLEEGYTAFVSYCGILKDEFIVIRLDGQGSVAKLYTKEDGLKEIKRCRKIDERFKNT